MFDIRRSSSRSMSLWCFLSLLTLCLAPGSQGQSVREQTAAESQLGESDAICHQRGCHAVFFQKKNFREARQTCMDGNGTLVTMQTQEAAGFVHKLLSSAGVQGSGTLRLWIGLHRAPRQCSSTKPLRGFTWVAGNQDGSFTNWNRKIMPNTCAVHRCVAMTVHTSENGGESGENFRWIEGPCLLKLDGFICQYTYRGMCPPVEDEGWGPAVYETPFHFKSTQLTHLPYGSVVDLSCPPESSELGAPSRESMLCIERDDGRVSWSKDPPFCSPSATKPYQDWCSNNHNCEQHCQSTHNYYYCYCSDGYTLDKDGTSCIPDKWSQTNSPVLSDSAFATEQPHVNRICVDMGCEYDCSITARNTRCTCPPGYQIASDGRKCLDVDECRQGPCPQLCVNTPGTFHCTCFPGYQPDSSDECVDIDECRDEGTCEFACENVEGSYLCLCNPGFESNSNGECIDLDECQHSTCDQHCINLHGSFKCDCDSGFELKEDGITCQPSSYDGEYSTMTPDPSLYDDPDFYWATQDPYFKGDGNFNIDSLTDAPQVLTPDMAHQSDNHLSQWEESLPEQYQTVPSPTQITRTGNHIDDDVHPGGGENNNRMTPKKADISPSETEEAETPKIESTDQTNTTADSSSGGKRKHDKSWLLVALLVPLCVFLVVMLALGIVYLTSCAVDKSLSFADCYRWVLPATPPERREGKTHA
ncbi:PREDICTED: endosialin [Cyprinodon variegatus]|uniref:CD248 molecule n=1 Tax=Cyprinodon variegatus TaxID=28743 RepID=A0A3Q2E8R9_CYPVA|nr:PREDICTED: endosialin [Cyprinodon variegatus]